MTLLTLCFWTSSCYSCDRIHFCVFEPPSLWHLLWQPPETNTPSLLISSSDFMSHGPSSIFNFKKISRRTYRTWLLFTLDYFQISSSSRSSSGFSEMCQAVSRPRPRAGKDCWMNAQATEPCGHQPGPWPDQQSQGLQLWPLTCAGTVEQGPGGSGKAIGRSMASSTCDISALPGPAVVVCGVIFCSLCSLWARLKEVTAAPWPPQAPWGQGQRKNCSDTQLITGLRSQVQSIRKAAPRSASAQCWKTEMNKCLSMGDCGRGRLAKKMISKEVAMKEYLAWFEALWSSVPDLWTLQLQCQSKAGSSSEDMVGEVTACWRREQDCRPSWNRLGVWKELRWCRGAGWSSRCSSSPQQTKKPGSMLALLLPPPPQGH